MKILEKFICGKDLNQSCCEDALIIKDDLIAVIDGATSKKNHLWDNMKSGRFAKNILSDFFNLKGVSNLYCENFFCALNSHLKKAIEMFSKEADFTEYPKASVIVYNDRYKEIWNYGDCQCKINSEIHSHRKKIDLLNSDLRAFYLENELLNGKTVKELIENDIGRDKIKINLLLQQNFENTVSPFGFPVINGQHVENSLIIKYSVHKNDEIILASDGYPFIGNSLNESEKALENIIKEDPLCFRKYRSTKGITDEANSFDDRTYCRFII